MSEPVETGELAPLLIPDGVNYNCQGCGRCCSGWSVGMTEADYARVKDIDWGALYPELKGKELFIHRDEEYKKGITSYPHFTQPRADGSCSFLVDNLCVIHSHLGEDAKPGTCQLFPYTFVETPSGTYTGVSMNSTAAVRNFGQSLTEQREKLEGYFAKLKNYLSNKSVEAGNTTSTVKQVVENPYASVVLNGQTSVSWEEFLHVDKKMIDIIKEAGRTDEDFILTLLKVEDVVWRACNMAKTEQPLSEIADYQPTGIAGDGESNVSTNEGIMAMVYYLYLVYPSVRAQFVDMWQLNNAERFSPGKVLRLLDQYRQYIGTGFSTIFFKNALVRNYGKVNLRKAIEYPVKPMPRDVQEFFRRWLYLKVFSKIYFGPAFCDYSLLAGFNGLVMSFICALVFAKGEAMKLKSDEIRLEDLYEGVFRVDREYLMMNQLLPQVAVALAVAYSVPKMGRGILQMLAKGSSADARRTDVSGNK